MSNTNAQQKAMEIVSATPADERPEPLVVVAEKNTKPSPIMVAYGMAAAEVYPQHFAANRCVNATWVCCYLMRRFGFKSAVAMSVECSVANKKLLDMLDEHGRFPVGDEVAEWRAQGAHMVAIDTQGHGEHVPNGFAGHLVCLVRGWMIDSASGQMHRPAKSIPMPEVLIAKYAPSFVKGKQPMFLQHENGSLMRYVARPTDQRHMEVTGFQGTIWNAEVANEIDARMRELLLDGGKRAKAREGASDADV